MTKAVCIVCGSSKDYPWAACPSCRFNPQGNDLEMAKSIYLSEGRFVGAEEPDYWLAELAELQASLKSGQAIVYDKKEIDRILFTKELLYQTPVHKVWSTLVRFFTPGLLLTALIWTLVWVLRIFRH